VLTLSYQILTVVTADRVTRHTLPVNSRFMCHLRPDVYQKVSTLAGARCLTLTELPLHGPQVCVGYI